MSNNTKHPVFYRACLLHGGRPDFANPDCGKVFKFTLKQILDKINRDRGREWKDYDETNWEEGLDEWTEYHPVTEAWEGYELVREYDCRGSWRLVETLKNQFGETDYWEDAPFAIRHACGEDWDRYPTLMDALRDFAHIEELYKGGAA